MALDEHRATYGQDLVGEVEQWNERDIVFARHDLYRTFGEDSPQFQAYYQAHPELLEQDRRMANAPALGRTGGVDAPMFGVQFAAIEHIAAESAVDGEPAARRATLSPDRAREKAKALARVLGADLVGVGPLHQEWVYSHVGRSTGDSPGVQPWGSPIDLNHHPHAIALGFRMDLDLIRQAPNFPTLLATAKGYADGAWVSVQLAHYIRMLGYSARAHHLRNYQVLCVPVAVDCGLGELSRAGYLITKELGLALRLAVVTTDLPLAHDAPIDIGVQSYCEHCLICAEECPIGAIPDGPKTACHGIRKWKLDEEKCYRYWHAVGTDCGICMAVCPWTKPQTPYHQAMAALASRKGCHQALMTWAHKLAYGTHRQGPHPAFLDPPEGGQPHEPGKGPSESGTF